MKRFLLCVLSLASPLASGDAHAQDACSSKPLSFYHGLRSSNPGYQCLIGDVVFGDFSVGWFPGSAEWTEIRPISAAGGWFGFEMLPGGLAVGTWTWDFLSMNFRWTTFAPTDAMRIAGASMNAVTLHPGTHATAQAQLGADGRSCSPFSVPMDNAYVRVHSESGNAPIITSRNPVSLSLATDRSFCISMEVSAWDEYLGRPPGIAGGASASYGNFQVRVVPEPSAFRLLLTGLAGLGAALLMRLYRTRIPFRRVP